MTNEILSGLFTVFFTTLIIISFTYRDYLQLKILKIQEWWKK